MAVTESARPSISMEAMWAIVDRMLTDDDTTHPAPILARPPEPPIGLALGAGSLKLRLAERRMSVTDDGRTLLDLSYGELRRIQFDIERDRPATLVVVPDRPIHEPQVVVVPPEQFEAAGEMLAYLGHRLDEDHVRSER